MHTRHSDTYQLGDRQVKRIGYGAMQLAGPGVFGPPKNIEAAHEVLREAIASGVNHIDTSDFYGPYVTNKIIREALAPYPDDLVIVSKIGARRDDKANWLPAFSAPELRQAVESNLTNLGIEQIEVINLRLMFGTHAPEEGSLEAPLSVLAELQQEGLIRHIGLSNVTMTQIEEAKKICNIVCVQNHYNLVHRHDDAMIDALAAEGIPYVPFFPLGGFTPIQSTRLNELAKQHQATPMQLALAFLLQRSENILLIPGTGSVAHLRENLAAAELTLSPELIDELNALA
ncbi:aldo/keto reductase family oxidoreductase [Superficieibacter sp.]|uniref:aldo/keto reductase family oxidoreductase n=1 Tax=Superficieibacter sp. TaxID=2303322 RepID=UPI0028AAF875|nr:aldo/keto reductase family oxidoreductase [Superficieibacter sp.]